MEKRTNSIYDVMYAALLEDDTLPEDFQIPSADPSGVQFADGAYDGVCLYHMKAPEKMDILPLVRILEKISAGNMQKAKEELEAFFPDRTTRTMLWYTDLTEGFILENRTGFDSGNLLRFAIETMCHSGNVEMIKFAMTLYRLLDIGKDETRNDLIRVLSLSDEFTFFGLRIMGRWANANEEFFRTARAVHGWGRIHAVSVLQPETEEIRDWLFREGIRNNILPAYSALQTAEKVNLEAILEELADREKMQTPEESDLISGKLKAAGRILKALVEDSPVRGMSSLRNRENIIRLYLQCAGQSKCTPEELASVLEALQKYLQKASFAGKMTLLRKCTEMIQEKK